jgi:diguanylate cyclase (GGDEF)-like protein
VLLFGDYINISALLAKGFSWVITDILLNALVSIFLKGPMEDDHSILLVQFFCLICAVAALSWALMAKPASIAPKASWRFSFANLCLGVGLTLYTYRTEFPSFSAWIIADIILLTGFSFLRQGTQSLFKIPTSLAVDLTIIGLATVSLTLVQFQANPIAKMVVVMSLATCLMFSLLTLDNYRAQRNNLSHPGVIIILLPLVSVALLFLMRAIVIVLEPNQIKNMAAINSSEAEPVLWSYVLLIILVNLILISNAISRLVQKIRNLANRDQLTKLWNRHALATHLVQIHAHWQREQQVYSVLLLDIDYFKIINDTYGHHAGDIALQHVAQLLTHSLRKIDFICRYGGEEFLIVLPSTPSEQALLIANKLNINLSKANFLWHNTPITVQGSIGIATIEDDMSSEQLMQIADRAMYQAKKQGRNSVCKGELIATNNEPLATPTPEASPNLD